MPRQNLAPNEAKRRRREQAKTGMRRLRREARERAEERLAAERRAVLASSSSETESESLVDTEEDDSDVAEGLAGDMEENLNIGGLDNQPQHLLVQGNEENAIAMQAHGEDYDEIVPPLQPIPFLSNTAVPQEEKLKELCRALAAVKAQTMTSESGMDKFLKVSD